MQPFRLPPPEPPRNNHSPALTIIGAVTSAVTALGLFGLFDAGVIDELTFLIVLAVVAAGVVAVTVWLEWSAFSEDSQRNHELPPPIDVISIWPIDVETSGYLQPIQKNRGPTAHRRPPASND